MAEIKEQIGIKDKVHIVLRGADGKVKDERKPRERKVTQGVRNVSGKKSRTS